MRLSEKIKAAREAKGFTQQKLSQISGVSLDSIKRYETKETSNITIGNLQKIAYALNLNIETIVSDLSPNDCPSFVPHLSPNPKSTQAESFYTIPVISLKASAGRGNEIMELESYEGGEVMCIDKGFFKTPPNAKVRIIQVEGYSMIPMLLPDSWVIFEESNMWRGDGLYVLNYDNELMVKLLQKLPNGDLEIISANKDYKSFIIEHDTQSIVRIVGKVLRSIL